MNGNEIFDRVANVIKVVFVILILRILLPAVGVRIRIPIVDDFLFWIVRMMRNLAAWTAATAAQYGIHF